MICIDFSGDYIDIIVATGTRDKVAVKSELSLKAPTGALNATGDVDFAVLEEFLQPVLAQISEKRVVMSFSFLPTIYSVLNLHKERNQAQQRMAVESQVYANISPNDYYVDYFATSNKGTNDGKLTYATYAMPKAVVDGCLAMVKNMGKTPVALVPSQFAAECFIGHYFANETVALAKLGSTNITLHLLNPPDNMITRDVLIDSAAGGASLDVLANIGSANTPETVFVQNIEKLNSYQNIKFPGQPIEKVLVYGNSAREELVSLVNNSVGLPSSLLSYSSDGLSISSPVYTLGGYLSTGRQSVNFFNAINNKKLTEKSVSKKVNVPLLVSSIVLVLNIAVASGLIFINMQAAGDVSGLEDELNSPETIELIEQYGTLRVDYVSRLKGEAVLTELEADIESMGEFSRDVLNRSVAVSPDSVTVVSVAYSNNTYNLVCTGQTEQQASDYVKLLTDMDLFSSVSYFGYSESEQAVTFTVTGQM